jgi:signal peptidase I
MKYLLVALINAVYGIMLLTSITRNTPGLILIVFIGGILAILGIVGFGLWLWEMISSVKERPKSAELALKSWWQIAKGIDILLILGLLFRFFVLQPFVVDGNSMEPNYHDKEYLLVNQLTYRLRAPERGETIIFRYPKDPQEDFIKRIVGLPGETLEIDHGQVYINDLLLEENYINVEEALSGQLSKITLKNDEYFVMGDNRNHSSDSRDWGALPRKNIIGRAWLNVYPLRYWGLVKNPAINLVPISAQSFNLVSQFVRMVMLN